MLAAVDFFQLHFGHPGPFHGGHGEAVIFVLESVTLARNALQSRHYKSGECFETFIPRKRDIVLRLEVEQILRSVEQHSSGTELDGRADGFVKLILDLTDHLLEDIFYGHDS